MAFAASKPQPDGHLESPGALSETAAFNRERGNGGFGMIVGASGSERRQITAALQGASRDVNDVPETFGAWEQARERGVAIPAAHCGARNAHVSLINPRLFSLLRLRLLLSYGQSEKRRIGLVLDTSRLKRRRRAAVFESASRALKRVLVSSPAATGGARRLSLAAAAVLFCSLGVFRSAAQDTVRPSLTGAQAAMSRATTTVNNDYYNFKFGAIRFTLADSVGLEFNDNINLADTTPTLLQDTQAGVAQIETWQAEVAQLQADLKTLHLQAEQSERTAILDQIASLHGNIAAAQRNKLTVVGVPSSDMVITPTVSMVGQWQATNMNTLRISLNLSYNYYLEHPQYNALAMSVGPGSAISYDIYVGGITKLTLADAFTVTQDPTQQAALSNVVNFERFVNTFSTSALWDLNQLVVTTIYAHSSNNSMNGTYLGLNSNADSLTASAAYRINSAINLGAEAGETYSYFSENVQNASIASNLGAFAEWNVSKHVKLRVASGIQNIEFATGGTNGDTSTATTSPYFNASLAHQLNRFTTETIEVARETSLGLQTNYQVIDSISYTLDMRIMKAVTTGISAFYQHVGESGNVDFAKSFSTGEQIDQLGIGLNTSYKLSKRLQVGAGYQFTMKDSNFPQQGYSQNRFTMSATYQF